MKQNEREELRGIRIPPAVLLREILKGWRFMLLLAVLFAVLMAGFRYVRYTIEKNRNVEEDTLTAEFYEKAAAVLKTKINDKKEHLVGSILAELNPYEMPYAEAAVMVSGGNAAVVDDAVNRLSFYALVKVDWTALAEKQGTEAKYLEELIAVSDKPEDNQFLVRIRHRSEEEAGEMMAYLLRELAEFDAELQETVGPHVYEVADWSTRTDVDTVYADYSESQFNRIATLETVLANFKQRAENARGGSAQLSKKTLLKYMILGGGLGFAASVFLLAVFIFLKDRLLDARELKALYGTINLAVFPQERAKKKFVLDRWIDAIGRDPAEAVPAEESYRIIGEKLAAAAPEASHFALIGDVGEKELAELAAVLSAKIPPALFAPAPALSKTAFSVRSVREADAVILVGKTGESRFGRTDSEMEQAAELGKKTVGSIVI